MTRAALRDGLREMEPIEGPDYQDEASLLGYTDGLPGTLVSDGELTSAIADLARAVGAESRPHPDSVVERFALLAATHIHGVAHASVMLAAGNRGLRCITSSDIPEVVDDLIDRVQEEIQEGPCLDAMENRSTVRVDDLATETRWQRFTQAVVPHTAVRSMLCYRLYTGVRDLGVLSLRANTRHAFDAEAEESGRVLATHASLTLHAVHQNRQFRSALGSRDIIGQAKGMLMERYGVSASEAFALLTRLSEESHHPVVVIAKELVEGSTRMPPGCDNSQANS